VAPPVSPPGTTAAGDDATTREASESRVCDLLTESQVGAVAGFPVTAQKQAGIDPGLDPSVAPSPGCSWNDSESPYSPAHISVVHGDKRYFDHAMDFLRTGGPGISFTVTKRMVHGVDERKVVPHQGPQDGHVIDIFMLRGDSSFELSLALRDGASDADRVAAFGAMEKLLLPRI